MSIHHRIIIIDDEPSIRNSLENYLLDFGYEITTVACAEDALEQLKQESYSVAIVDIRLPGLDGDGFIQEAHLKYPEMKYIIHTGANNYILPEYFKAIGLKSPQLFIKPIVDLSQLLKTIESLTE